ncbi:heme A synthase [Flaviaesturariibacter flavus]|uniref:Heme A synthase n=2 Tax=Flaviaesturariibacter flavus TaxID=2502780 RepID=A0A4R1B696_9BACT|nr:heme A synthase [Flaviaesturariibacter flavus]
MVIVQVILGGITRLTGSGLSITEWNVVTGALPPLNQGQWLAEFHKYQQSPQYRLLNSDFQLSDFKFIYFWEWFHRLWGRLIGVVFAIPFVVFLVQRRFRQDMIKPLLVLFILGGLQGAIGWIMVASGLEGDAIYVKPTRLALHFIFALGLLCYTFWFALQLLTDPHDKVTAPRLRTATWWIVGLLGLQLIFGALMAGHRAAPAAPTWPDINGTLVPRIFPHGLVSAIEDRITIHFIHRNLAYLLTVFILVWTYRAFRRRPTALFAKTRILPLLLVLVQVALGVATVLTSVHIRPARWNDFEWMAQLHQFTALLLLLALVANAFLLRNKRPSVL